MDLYHACCIGDLIKVIELIENGENPSTGFNSPIRWASAKGHVIVVAWLLRDKRVNPAACNNSAIINASYHGHTKVVEILLEDERVDPTDWNNEAIRAASKNGHVDVVKVLLEDGRVEPTEHAILYAATDEIKEMLTKYKYRVDGLEYLRMKEQN